MSVISADRRWLLGLVLMSLLVAACYLIAMNAFWVGDDFNYVRPKSWVEVGNFFNPVGRAQFRPLTWTTWATGFALFGTEPLGWHLARLVQHIWNAVWAALLIRSIIGRRDVALLAAAIFALHPAQPQTVTWLGGQADASFAMLWLPALWLFVRWRQGLGAGRGLWLLAGLLGFLSMFGKEAALTLPVMSLWIDLLYGREWARRPGKRLVGWWRDAGTWLRLLRDHSLFIGAAGAYVGLRLVLFLTGQGRLMYGEDQLGFLRNGLDVAVGYIVLALGCWWMPPLVNAWSGVLKVGILLATLVGVVLVVRWLGRNAVFALGWFGITLLLTLQAVALRWFYLPALGVGVLFALIYARLRDTEQKRVHGLADSNHTAASPSRRSSMQLAPARLMAISVIGWLGWQTVSHNLQWVDAGEKARSILRTVRTVVPEPVRPATFYVRNAPYGFKDVLLFNTGLDSAMLFTYRDWTTIRAYSTDEDTAQVNAALSNPANVGSNPYFLMFTHGGTTVTPYLSLGELLAAPTE